MVNEKKAKYIYFSLSEQFKRSNRNIEVLEPIPDKTSIIKAKWEIPDDTLLGVIVYRTGGIVFDNWIRLIGSGERDISSWNDILGIEDYIVVADDVLGGLFGLNMKDNSIHYFAPDTLEWEDMGMTYSQLIQWLVECDIDKFYELFRWNNWAEEIKNISFTNGIAFYPFLWARAEGERHREITPLKEIVLLSFDMKRQLGI